VGLRRIRSSAWDGDDRLSLFAISKDEARMLGRSGLVERLVEEGTSRLTAERVAALEFSNAEPGRARYHTHARR
jgi:hypothetical protein